MPDLGFSQITASALNLGACEILYTSFNGEISISVSPLWLPKVSPTSLLSHVLWGVLSWCRYNYTGQWPLYVNDWWDWWDVYLSPRFFQMSSFPTKAKSYRFDLIIHQREFYLTKGTDLFWFLQLWVQLQRTHQGGFESYPETAEWSSCFLLNVSTSVLLNFELKLRILEIYLMPSSWHYNQPLRGKRNIG